MSEQKLCLHVHMQHNCAILRLIYVNMQLSYVGPDMSTCNLVMWVRISFSPQYSLRLNCGGQSNETAKTEVPCQIYFNYAKVI